jgi:hypothetical protein
MLDEVFAEAVVHRPAPWSRRALAPFFGPSSGHAILGLRVRPFSFWHAFNLDLVGGIGDPGSLNRFNTLLLTARCCRLRYPQTISSTGIFETLLYQVASLRFAFRFAKSYTLRLAQVKKFLDYRADYADCVPEIAEGGEPVKLPGYLYHVALLRRLRPELTKAQAWDFPVAEGQWEILSALAADGAKIDVLTPEDRKDLAEMEAEATSKITPFNGDGSPPSRGSHSARGRAGSN